MRLASTHAPEGSTAGTVVHEFRTEKWGELYARRVDEMLGVLKARGRFVIVVNDRRGLYPEILERSGLVLEQRYQRHVNRRTGRRAGEYFEDVLVARRG